VKTEAELEALKFGEAMQELERIVASIEGDDVDLDDLAEQVDRAAALIQLCRDRIERTQTRVRKIIDGLEPEDGGDG